MPTLVPTIVLNDTRVDRHHGCTRVMEAFDALLATNGCHVIARASAHSDWESDPGVLATASEARLVVVNGEGTIHHDRPGGIRLLRAGSWARERGIPAALLNCGWEANGADAVRRLADFSLVAVRDSRSAVEIRHLGGSCRVVPDLSLFAPWMPPGFPRQGIVFTDNVDRYATLNLDRARHLMQADWLPIQADGNGTAERVDFVRGGIASSDLRRPHVAFRMARVRLSLARQRLASPDQFLSELSKRKLLVTGRFHSCTLAMLARTPFVSLPSNTGKIQALVQDAGLATWRCASDLTQASLTEAMQLGWQVGEQSALTAYIDNGRDAMETLFRDVRGLA
jgi:hypothetical protein